MLNTNHCGPTSTSEDHLLGLVSFRLLISGHRGARFLIELGEERELLDLKVSDKGPKFTYKAKFQRFEDSETQQAFIQPEKPTRTPLRKA